MFTQSTPLSKKILQENLKNTLFPSVTLLPEIDSTNRLAHEISTKSHVNHLILANAQTAGRGRHGRTFLSPEGGIYLSLLLHPTLAVCEVSFFTITAALAVCDAVETLYALQPQIKWQNDIYLDGKKLCGILCEGKISHDSYDTLIVGIGINDDMPQMPVENATSLAEHTSLPRDKNTLVLEIVRRFTHYYHMLQNKDYSFMRLYRAKNLLLGHKIVLPDGHIFTVQDINDYGHLVIMDEHGTHTLCSGDISLHGYRDIT